MLRLKQKFYSSLTLSTPPEADQQLERGGDEKGVALIMVLAALALISSLVLEFVDHSRVNFNLAMNQKERLQAYYLAESGINFAKLLIEHDQKTKKLAEDASKRLGRNIQVPPLYELIPIDSNIFKGLSQMGTSEESAPAGETEKTDEASSDQPPKSGLGVMDEAAAKEFLSFEGDFAAEVSEEESKLNLGGFYTLRPSQKEYDSLKATLYYLLLSEEFKEDFKEQTRGVKDLVQNIADYIDVDESKNEAGGQDNGQENFSSKPGVAGGGGKNGRLLSLEELMQVPGITDSIFYKLKNYVTVYGKDEKIYVCRAKDSLIKAMIVSYTENNPRMEPLKTENKELLDKALTAVQDNCPDVAAVSAALDKVLGVESGGGDTLGRTDTDAATSPASSGSGAVVAATFDKFIKSENKVYGIIGKGTSGNAEVQIKTVIDISEGNAKNWKTFYWRVE